MRTGEAGCERNWSASRPRPRSLAGEDDLLRRRGRALLRRAPQRSSTSRSSRRLTRSSTRSCPASGPLAERYIAWRESQAVPVEKLDAALHSLAEDFRERTQRLFGLPDGEMIEWLLETDKPWSGFNYYLGGLRSRVAINTDLPVLSPSLGHLVAHEAYPGHHTEHTRKEAGLVRRHGHLEETIFLVGTPAVPAGRGPGRSRDRGAARSGSRTVARGASAPARHPLRHRGDRGSAHAGETLGAVRGNAAWLLHQEGRPAEEVVGYFERWSLLPRARAEKAVQFLTDPTWRAYISCYIEGLRLCRSFVAGEP